MLFIENLICVIELFVLEVFVVSVMIFLVFICVVVSGVVNVIFGVWLVFFDVLYEFNSFYWV